MYPKIQFVTFALVITGIFMVAHMAIAQDGLVSHWDFNRGSVEDRVGDNDGKIRGNPEIVEGQYGQALEFDGDKTEGVEVADDASIRIPERRDGLTIEAWIRVDATSQAGWGGAFGGIVAKRKAGVIGFYGLMMNGGGDALKWVVGAPGKGEANVVSATSVVGKGWMHVVATWDGKELALFFDGEEDGNSPRAAAVGANNAYILIGNHDAGILQPFVGAIDDVHIWSRALTPDEIESHFEDGPGPHAVGAANKLTLTWGRIKVSR